MSSDITPATAASGSEYPFHIGFRLVPHELPDGSRDFVEVPLTEEDFLHPQEEDRFLLTDPHERARFYLRHAIESHCREHHELRVFSDHRIDWQHPDYPAHGPDVVVFRSPDQRWVFNDTQGTFLVGDTDAQTVVVFEITSPSTRHIDLGRKFQEFEAIGIPYYVLVDVAVPQDQRGLKGYSWRSGRYHPMRHDPQLGFNIPELKMWFHWNEEEDCLVAFNEYGEEIPDSPEMAGRLEAERLRAEMEKDRANDERERAEAEKARAEAEKARAEALEREVAELKELLAQNKPQG
jgi:hypothetical protein